MKSILNVLYSVWFTITDYSYYIETEFKVNPIP